MCNLCNTGNFYNTQQGPVRPVPTLPPPPELTAIKTLDCMTSQRAQYNFGANLIGRKLSETKS